jgi:hypothetical protein
MVGAALLCRLRSDPQLLGVNLAGDGFPSQQQLRIAPRFGLAS